MTATPMPSSTRPARCSRRAAAQALAVLLLLLVAPAPRSAVAQQTARSRPQYPPLNGSRHNADHPTWGQSDTPYARIQVPHVASYATGDNGSDALAGANRPSPRAITLALLNQPYFKGKSATNTSYLLTALGQLVSHDITRGDSTPTSNGGPAPIPVPPGDPFFSVFDNFKVDAAASRRALPFMRSNYTRLARGGPREQINSATAWLDMSALYGQTAKVANLFRAGTAGRLLDDGQRLLPLNVDPLTGQPKNPNLKNVGQRVPLTQLRLAGNANVNQNPLVMSMVTLMMREHNRRAMVIEERNPSWGDERIFQEARKWVIGHFQRIALVDYLAALGLTLPAYKGYNASANPSIDAFFSTVAYRYGHATINDVILRLDDAWQEHPKGHLTLAFAYYNPNVALDAGLEPLLRGMLVAAQGRVEPRWSLAVSGNFAGHANVNGTDLAAINIQRGRDHGIPDYNTCRRALGLPAARTWADITPDPDVQDVLKSLYKSVNNIDAYVGGLSEPAHSSASHLGPLFTRSITEQFGRLRDADYFYYENGANNGLWNESEIDEIRKTSLRDIMARNTNITDLPSDLWAAGWAQACDAAGGDGGFERPTGPRELSLPSLLGGSARLLVKPADTDGWARVTVSSSSTSGWLGFGVANPDSTAPMIGADMVVGRMVDGKAQVRRYHAIDHVPPHLVPPEAQAPRLKVIRFEQSPAGGVVMEFERPLGDGPADNDREMPAASRLRLIIARGTSNEFSSLANGYHGTSNREIIELPRGLYAGSASLSMDTSARSKRRAHGVLMAVNFMVIMPLGALAARQLRSHWLRLPAVRASLFYVHIATQVAGVAIATSGFVIATRWFGVPYDRVQWGHGKLGVAILVLVYSQLIVGFLRPTASAPTVRRQAWDMIHTTLGRVSMLLGVVNVALGVFIFTTMFGGHLAMWGGLCAASLGAISLLQYVLDRQEKYAVLKNDDEMRRALLGATDAKELADALHHHGGGDGSSHPGAGRFDDDGHDYDGAGAGADAAAAAGAGSSMNGRGPSSGGGGAAAAGAAGAAVGAGAMAAGHQHGGAGGSDARAMRLTPSLLARHAGAADTPPQPGFDQHQHQPMQQQQHWGGGGAGGAPATYGQQPPYQAPGGQLSPVGEAGYPQQQQQPYPQQQQQQQYPQVQGFNPHLRAAPGGPAGAGGGFSPVPGSSANQLPKF